MYRRTCLALLFTIDLQLPKEGFFPPLAIPGSTGKKYGKALQYSCLENPMNNLKRQKDKTLKDELPRSVGVQYGTGKEWRNNSKKNEEMEPKKKQHLVVNVTGVGGKV